MAYYGSGYTTVASSLQNPPRSLVGPFASNQPIAGSTAYLQSNISTAANANNAPGGGGGNLWIYNSTNLTTDLKAANFFSDGFYIGMRPGDIVMGAQIATSDGTTIVTYMAAITSVSTAGASLSTGTILTSTFN
jgi:hypothetical protein